MYAQITITARYDSAELRQALAEQNGASAVTALDALQSTTFATKAVAIAPTVVAAQLLRDATAIVYFFDGPDTILVHITAATVTELKAQAKRVTRQMLPFLKSRRKVIRASLVVPELQQRDVLIINGERVALPNQILDVLSDKWLSRLVVPASIFALTAYRMSGTTAAQSAGIGVLAALIALLVEIGLFVYHAEEWKWKDVS
jgi:hypothetical protein